jgi:hypothetical protein
MDSQKFGNCNTYKFILLILSIFLIYTYTQSTTCNSKLNKLEYLELKYAELKEFMYKFLDTQLTVNQITQRVPYQHSIDNPQNMRPSQKLPISTSNPNSIYVPNNLDDQIYRQVGFLFSDTSNERYPLYGRNLYVGNNNKQEYYVIDGSRNKIKIPIKNNNILDGDNVNVEFIGDTKAVIYPIEQKKYNPNLEM